MQPTKLDVVQTVQSAVMQAWGTLGKGLRASAAWIAATIAISLLLAGALDPSAGADPDAALTRLTGGQLLAMVLAGLIVLTVVSAAAASWHRYLLRGEAAPFLPSLDRRAFVYTGYSLLMLVFAIIYSILGGFVLALFLGPAPSVSVEWIAAIIIALSMVLILGRLSLVMPAVALGERHMPLAEAWARTTRNGWRILACFVVVGFVTWLPGQVLEAIALAAPSLSLFVLFGSMFLAAISFLLTIALLCQLYKRLGPDAVDVSA